MQNKNCMHLKIKVFVKGNTDSRAYYRQKDNEAGHNSFKKGEMISK